MLKVSYPRPSSIVGRYSTINLATAGIKLIAERLLLRVLECLYCEKSFGRLDNCKRHIKNVHSEGAKRKAEERAELLRMELLNSEKVPRLSLENQNGGAVNTRSKKREDD